MPQVSELKSAKVGDAGYSQVVGSGEPLWKQLRKRRAKAATVLDLLGIREPPIPVDHIVRALGVALLDTEDGSIGSVDVGESHAVIRVNPSLPLTRWRFTVAHEI